jgi:hypothetical protein
MPKKIKVILLGEQHVDPAPIYCLRKLITLLQLKTQTSIKIAAEFEKDKSLAEMHDFFIEIINQNKVVMAHPALKPYVRIKGNHMYMENSEAARYALSIVFGKPGNIEFINSYFEYLIQHERFKETIKLFKVIKKFSIDLVGIDLEKNIIITLMEIYGREIPRNIVNQISPLREEHMAEQIIQYCIEPLIKNSIGDTSFVFVYLGSSHVTGVKEKIYQNIQHKDITIEIIPLAVFTEANYEEIIINKSAIEEMDGKELNFPDKIIAIPQSDSGTFDDHEFFEFMHEQLAIPNDILSPNDRNVVTQSTSSEKHDKRDALKAQSRKLLWTENTDDSVNSQKSLPCAQNQHSFFRPLANTAKALAATSALALSSQTASYNDQPQMKYFRVETNFWLLTLLASSALIIASLSLLFLYRSYSSHSSRLEGNNSRSAMRHSGRK